jgi:hypothetical protein
VAHGGALPYESIEKPVDDRADGTGNHALNRRITPVLWNAAGTQFA